MDKGQRGDMEVVRLNSSGQVRQETSTDGDYQSLGSLQDDHSDDLKNGFVSASAQGGR